MFMDRGRGGKKSPQKELSWSHSRYLITSINIHQYYATVMILAKVRNYSEIGALECGSYPELASLA